VKIHDLCLLGRHSQFQVADATHTRVSFALDLVMSVSRRATSSNGRRTRTRKANHVRMCTAFRLPSYNRRIQTYYLLSYSLTSCDCCPRAFESLNLILLYAFNTFVIMRYICVTQRFFSLARRHIYVTFLTHIRVQVD